MTNKDLEKLIASGESDQLEFKSSFGKEAVETLCAFANSEGGQVLVGVSDTGQITGLNLSGETLQGWLNQIKQSTTPSLLPDISVSEVAAEKIVTIEKLKTDTYQSRARNKLVAEAFYLTKDIEKYGSGYIRVREEIKSYPTMRFDYEESGDGYLVSLGYSQQKTATTPKATPKATPKTKERLLELIKKNNQITREELSQRLGIGINGVKQQILKLKKEGILERVGDNRTGFWKVKGRGRRFSWSL